MIRGRVSLAWSMGWIGVFAAGLALLKAAPEGAEGWTGLAFFAALLAGTLGIVVRRRRAAWIGFALFGWSYCLAASVPAIKEAIGDRLPADQTIDRLVVNRFHPRPPVPTNPLSFQAWRAEDHYLKRDDTFGTVSRFQPTPGEAKQIDAYTIQYQSCLNRDQAARRARRIAYDIGGLAFSLLGAALGRALSDRDAPWAIPTSSLPA